MNMDDALRYIPFGMEHDYLQKKCFDLLISHMGRESMCKDIICTCMVLYVPFPFIKYAT